MKGGFTIYDVLHGVVGYGLGVSGSPIPKLVTALDFIVAKGGSLNTVKAGVGGAFSVFLVSAGLGSEVNTAVQGVRVPGGFSFSLGFVPSKNFRLIYSYNQVELHYFGLTVGF
ncbi:MAG: hypothetical protein HY075_13660 [Deltaproteobacteria bacterium]|nr:hypothetical protein [Deltaproteobacteria bacterium]